jgi:hypothetical protein
MRLATNGVERRRSRLMLGQDKRDERDQEKQEELHLDMALLYLRSDRPLTGVCCEAEALNSSCSVKIERRKLFYCKGTSERVWLRLR